MSFIKRLYSKKFFIANLVLVGVIAGFALAYTGFSRAASRTALGSVSALAETPTSSAPADVKAALSQAEAVQSAFRYVAEKVKPSVVEVRVIERQTKQANPLDQLPWRFNFPDQGNAPDQQDQPDNTPFQQEGIGSGIIVRQDGKSVYVLTNYHVAGEASKITIVTGDEKEHDAVLVGKGDARRDIALVKFESSDPVSVATLGDSSNVRVGDWAIAIGSPFGLVSSVTAGIVSAVGRDSGGPDGNISDFIQTDASINKGNSGGALVNIRGEVIGMNTWIASTTGGSIGLGFSLPINNAKKAISDFIDKGEYQSGWIGIGMSSLDKATASELGADPKKGAFAASVFKDSPADKAGILPGDVVLKVNGQEIKGTEQLSRIVGDLPVGKAAAIEVLRDGKTVSLSATIEKRDEKVASIDGNYFPGVIVISTKSDDLNKEKLPKDAKGVYVVNVSDKSPGSKVGLKAGDIITQVNEKAISTARDFYRLINDASAKKVSFTVLRDGDTVTTLAYTKK
jgi:Do/DeqQ family serine protease